MSKRRKHNRKAHNGAFFKNRFWNGLTYLILAGFCALGVRRAMGTELGDIITVGGSSWSATQIDVILVPIVVSVIVLILFIVGAVNIYRHFKK